MPKKKKKSNPSSSVAHARAGRRNIMVWLDSADYKLVQDAAIEAGSPVTQFVVWAALSAAFAAKQKSK